MASSWVAPYTFNGISNNQPANTVTFHIGAGNYTASFQSDLGTIAIGTVGPNALGVNWVCADVSQQLRLAMLGGGSFNYPVNSGDTVTWTGTNGSQFATISLVAQ